MAGLAAATVLSRAGRTVRILEAGDRVGGRVGGTGSHDHVRDAGFQVLFPAYPHLRSLMDVRRLDLRPVDRGAWIRDPDGRWRRLMDPRQDPLALSGLLTAPWWQFSDAGALLRLTLLALRGDATLRTGSTAALLREAGVSDRLVEAFFRPFFGGVQLSDTLEAPAAEMLVAWRMLAEGGAALPARGMQAVADALAIGCGAEVETGRKVIALMMNGDRVTGVRTADGESIEAETVVVASHPSAWRTLLPECTIPEGRKSVSLHIYSDKPLVPGRRLLLGRPTDPFRVACPVSTIAPAYAPDGLHQTVFQVPEVPEDGEAWLRQVLSDFSPADTIHARLGHVHTDLAAQFWPTADRPSLETPRQGVFLASDAQVRSSIDGALEAGIRAAERVLAP